ncbi:MAG: hypothetical protein KDB53_11295 [Planctomycetes bacterium]|nr:hypothetical protein [Planctomycetota bacterium]
MTTATLRLLVAVLVLGTALSAQSDVDTRRREAETQLAGLRERVGRLSPASGATLARLPTPPAASLRCLIELEDLAAKAKEWPELEATARRLLIQARLAAGDLSGVRSDIRDRLAEPKVPDSEQQSLSTLQARLCTENGDYRGALEAVKALGSTPRSAEWEALAIKLEEQVALLLNALASNDSGRRRGAEHGARRFAATYPLHPQSRVWLEHFLADLPADATGRVDLVERLLYYAPDSELAPAQLTWLLGELFREGEYEKVLLHAHRWLMQPGALSANDLASLGKLKAASIARLDRVAARGLPAGSDSKTTRLIELRRAASRGDDPWDLAERMRAFAEDYPQATELPSLRLAVAKRLHRQSPEDARPSFEAIIAAHRGSPESLEALELVLPALERADGPEATLEWLEARRSAFSEPAAAAAEFAYRRATLLDQLQRWEEAREVLAPFALETDPKISLRAKNLIEALDAKINR